MKRRKLSKVERRIVYEKCNGHCAYCGCNLQYKDMQVDHVIPLNGYKIQGEDTIENMLPACRSCNHYKRTSSLESFRKAIENMPEVLMRDSVTYKNAVRFGLVRPDPHSVRFYFEVMNKDPSVKDLEAADLEQAVEYFQNELSSINVFSDLVSFKEEEKKSIETALNVLRKALEDTEDGSRTSTEDYYRRYRGSAERATQNQGRDGNRRKCDVAQEKNITGGYHGGSKNMPDMREGI